MRLDLKNDATHDDVMRAVAAAGASMSALAVQLGAALIGREVVMLRREIRGVTLPITDIAIAGTGRSVGVFLRTRLPLTKSVAWTLAGQAGQVRAAGLLQELGRDCLLLGAPDAEVLNHE